MDELLQSFYHDHLGLIVPFLCVDYKNKEWCGLEWRAIKDLIKQRQSKDIMPMRFDDTKIKGLFSIDGYVDLSSRSVEQAVELILQRLGLNNGGQQQAATNQTHSNRLPNVEGKFFGRRSRASTTQRRLGR